MGRMGIKVVVRMGVVKQCEFCGRNRREEECSKSIRNGCGKVSREKLNRRHGEDTSGLTCSKSCCFLRGTK